MNWVAINKLSNKLPFPHGYRMEQLKRSEIPELIRCFKVLVSRRHRWCRELLSARGFL
jgi:hypothetical protein